MRMVAAVSMTVGGSVSGGTSGIVATAGGVGSVEAMTQAPGFGTAGGDPGVLVCGDVGTGSELVVGSATVGDPGAEPDAVVGSMVLTVGLGRVEVGAIWPELLEAGMLDACEVTVVAGPPGCVARPPEVSTGDDAGGAVVTTFTGRA